MLIGLHAFSASSFFSTWVRARPRKINLYPVSLVGTREPWIDEVILWGCRDSHLSCLRLLLVQSLQQFARLIQCCLMFLGFNARFDRFQRLFGTGGHACRLCGVGPKGKSDSSRVSYAKAMVTILTMRCKLWKDAMGRIMRVTLGPEPITR